jgi:hypothetical protein
MPNQAIKNLSGDVKVEAKASIAGVTSEPEAVPVPAPVAPAPVPVAAPKRPAFNAPPVAVAPKGPECPKCKDTHRVIFTEKGRGIRSVGPCECVKA